MSVDPSMCLRCKIRLSPRNAASDVGDTTGEHGGWLMEKWTHKIGSCWTLSRVRCKRTRPFCPLVRVQRYNSSLLLFLLLASAQLSISANDDNLPGYRICAGEHCMYQVRIFALPHFRLTPLFSNSSFVTIAGTGASAIQNSSFLRIPHYP